jgi:putative tricarboxylic transport membrane protein
MRGEKYVTALIFAVSAAFFVLATRIPPPHLESPLGAGFWPKVILLLLFVTSGIHLGKLLLRKKEVEERLARETEQERKREEEETGERKVFSLLVFGIGISFLYIYIVRWIGFIVATPIFMAVFMYITGYRKKIMVAVVSLATVAIFLLLFVKATYIPLPRGFGIFKEISVLFY